MNNPLSLSKRKKRYAWIALLPMVFFTVLFVLGPVIYLVVLSFSRTLGASGIDFSFTLVNYKRMVEDIYRNIFLDSLILGLLTTFLVAIIGYPFGYFMAKLSKKWQSRMNAALMVPFWVSSLLRLYGWVIVFRSNGILDLFLMKLGFTAEPLKLLYTETATVVGMVYALLPMMIFAVYSSAEKLDWRLVEASRDLGASPLAAFRDVSFPLTLPGLLSGVILTFIPSMGLIFIAELLGGNRVILIGNLIYEQATSAHNIPFAAALSVVLMVITGVFITLYKKAFHVKELEGII